MKELEAAVEEQQRQWRKALADTVAERAKREEVEATLRTRTEERDGLVRAQIATRRDHEEALVRARSDARTEALQGRDEAINEHGEWMFVAGAELARRTLAGQISNAARGFTLPVQVLDIIRLAGRAVTGPLKIAFLERRHDLIEHRRASQALEKGTDRSRG